MQQEIVSGSLLYHEVHGLCRVDQLVKQTQAGKEVLCYSLLPKVANKMKVRFVISSTDIETSGFHSLIASGTTPKLLTNERDAIHGMLRECQWNVSEAARRLGMDRGYLHRKIKRYGLARDGAA